MSVEQLAAYVEAVRAKIRERSKRYYDNHKEEVLKQQKEYKSSIPKEAKARIKILYYLNNDSEYTNAGAAIRIAA